MSSPADDIMSMLENADLSLVFAENLHVGKEPAKPDNVVTVYDTGGEGPALTLDNIKYQYASIQIRVRNRAYKAALNLAYDIIDELHGKHNESVGTLTYTLVRCTSSPVMLRWDENQRVIIVINFQIQRR